MGLKSEGRQSKGASAATFDLEVRSRNALLWLKVPLLLPDYFQRHMVCISGKAVFSAAGSIMRCWEELECRMDEKLSYFRLRWGCLSGFRSGGGRTGAYGMLQSCWRRWHLHGLRAVPTAALHIVRPQNVIHGPFGVSELPNHLCSRSNLPPCLYDTLLAMYCEEILGARQVYLQSAGDVARLCGIHFCFKKKKKGPPPPAALHPCSVKTVQRVCCLWDRDSLCSTRIFHQHWYSPSHDFYECESRRLCCYARVLLRLLWKQGGSQVQQPLSKKAQCCVVSVAQWVHSEFDALYVLHWSTVIVAYCIK